MNTQLRLVLMLCFTAIYSATIGQNIPKTAQDIPIFPKAKINIEEQQQALKDFKEIYEGAPIQEYSISLYSVRTEIYEVCRFYIEKLGATEGFPEYDDGMNTKPWYEVSYFPDNYFEDQWEYDTKIWDGNWFKTAVEKRKQWEPGKWVQGAYFEWTVLQRDGNLAHFSIDISDDNSFDTRAKTAEDKTLIAIMSRIEISEDEWGDN
jgi:hypothetical protein